jgi:Fe-S-cluster containining protein
MDFCQNCYDCLAYIFCLPTGKETYRYEAIDKLSNYDSDDEIVFYSRNSLRKSVSPDDFCVVDSV